LKATILAIAILAAILAAIGGFVAWSQAAADTFVNHPTVGNMLIFLAPALLGGVGLLVIVFIAIRAVILDKTKSSPPNSQQETHHAK
jgi:TRAP-type C4-dicarboxylate transport system permease small subunit